MACLSASSQYELPGLDIEESEALSINDNGLVVASFSLDGEKHFFLWDQSQGVTIIDLPNTALVTKITNAGQIIGNYRDNNNRTRGFFWDPSNGFIDLCTLCRDGTIATSITNCRQVTVANKTCDDSRCAYERRDPKTGTIMHFDKYGNLIGRTKG